MTTAGAAQVTLEIADRARFVRCDPTIASGTTLIFMKAERLAMAHAMEALFVAMLTTVVARWAWRSCWIELGGGGRCTNDKKSGCDNEGFHGTRIPK
jgi:hypothetical protein